MSAPRRFARPGRVVVKIGSSSLRAPDGGLDRDLAGDLVAQIADLHRQGVAVVLVSSGAVAAGLAPLGLAGRPSDLPGLQAAASVGQGLLLHTYQARFAGHGIACGQVLLTTHDVIDRIRFLNARNTFHRLLGLGAVPVVNENDTVATDELRFTDNDRLAALVASMLHANLLVLLSDVDGLHDGHPSTGSPLISKVAHFRDLQARHYGASSSGIGTGGMASKLEAARIATFSAAHAVIANARRPGVLGEVVDGCEVGTWFPPSRRRPESRKLWIAFARHPRGRILVDDGAVRALTQRGSSLLAAGITDALGDFGPGDAVDVVGPDGGIVARGLVAYDQGDVLKVRGMSSDRVAAVLGDAARAAVIHRDQLIVVA